MLEFLPPGAEYGIEDDKLSLPICAVNEEWLSELLRRFLGLAVFLCAAVFWNSWLLNSEFDGCLVNGDAVAGVNEGILGEEILVFGDGSNPFMTSGPKFELEDSLESRGWLLMLMAIPFDAEFGAAFCFAEILAAPGFSAAVLACSLPSAVNVVEDPFLDSGVDDSFSNFVKDETGCCDCLCSVVDAIDSSCFFLLSFFALFCFFAFAYSYFRILYYTIMKRRYSNGNNSNQDE